MSKFFYSLGAILLSLTIISLDAQARNMSDWAKEPRLKCEPGKRISLGKTTIEKTVDGDTAFIRTSKGIYSVRMLSMDTPETHFNGHSQGKWGEIASERLAELLPEGSTVRVELADAPCDKYGRLLGHFYVGKTHINRKMVEEGLAVNYCYAPSFKYCEDFADLVDNAIKNRLGMFSDSNVELPYDFRERMSGRKPSKFVGHIDTKKVVAPEHQERVPVAKRVFFPTEDLIVPPYRLVK